jgi:hypothetical protein
MAIAITLDDFIANKKLYVVFIDKDFDDVFTQWMDPTKFIPELANQLYFKNTSRWSDLSLSQWKILTASKLHDVMMLPEVDQLNEKTPSVQTLHFFIKGLIHKLQSDFGGIVDHMKIQRINEDTVNFNIAISECLCISAPVTKKPHLKVIDGAG